MSQFTLKSKRIEREKITIGKMIELYCDKNHVSGSAPCDTCCELKEYAFLRLLNCPFNEEKPICSDCTVHCYNKEMQSRMKDVMRFAGPRMLYRHPYLAIMHFIDGKINKSVSLRKMTD
jgi:hypothetical protein